MNTRTKSDGFTLIEVLVSMMVASIGILGVMGLSSWLIRASSWVDHTKQATLMAEGAFEALQGQNYATVGNGSDTVDGYARQWTVATAGNTKIIDVRVNWSGLEGGTRQVTFRSLLANPAVTGINFL